MPHMTEWHFKIFWFGALRFFKAEDFRVCLYLSMDLDNSVSFLDVGFGWLSVDMDN